MSLPASLTTDCGGLLNRRSPGRKRCCHTDALHVGYQVYSSHGWFLSRIIELSNWFIFTRSITESHGLIVPNLRIVEFFFTRRIAEVTVLLSRIIELSNFFSHGESRDLCHELSNCRISFHTEDHGGFLCHKTCSWSRICELSNFFLHTDGCGGYEGGTIEA